MRMIGKLKATIHDTPFEAEFGIDGHWHCEAMPHLGPWLDRRHGPQSSAGTIYTRGRVVIERAAKALDGEYEYYDLPENYYHKAKA